MEAALSETAPHENPLIPNRKLRQMYVAMVEARVLDEHLGKMQRRGKAKRRLDSIQGQEACRVSTAMDLQPGDFVSDAQRTIVMELVRGSVMEAALQRAEELMAGDEKTGVSCGQIAWSDDSADQLSMALGAAQVIRARKQSALVVVYVRHEDADGGPWKRALRLSAKLKLPIIFVVLPERKTKKQGHGAAKARACGVPGIPVDASDAVALYRVTQESMGRVRGGDGPVVIDCVVDRTQGKSLDPIAQMRGFLLGRKISQAAWLGGVADAAKKRLAKDAR